MGFVAPEELSAKGSTAHHSLAALEIHSIPFVHHAGYRHATHCFKLCQQLSLGGIYYQEFTCHRAESDLISRCQRADRDLFFKLDALAARQDQRPLVTAIEPPPIY